jgi:uroporphyrinogen-III decarboxylase
MTHRDRYLATMTFEKPDRVPFNPGWPRESTLKAWHGQGLPAGGDWRDHLLKAIGVEAGAIHQIVDLPVDLRMVPQFEEKVLEHRGGHYVVQEWSGNVCEISDEFDPTYLSRAKDFVTRRWISAPVRTPEDWEQMKRRYDPDSSGRFPADFEDLGRRAASREGVLHLYFRGPFWQLREWCGLEDLCFLLVEEPERVQAMAEFWTEFIAAMLEKVYRHVSPDVVRITEDMAYKGRSLISPEMVRRFCMPSWKRWSEIMRRGGTPVRELYSDGYVGDLVPLWIESGLNACVPMEVAAGCDAADFRRRFGEGIAFTGNVDKRCLAKGGSAIRDDLARIQPAIATGGFIPSCDHGVPGDISWPNFVDYARQLARMTGWL